MSVCRRWLKKRLISCLKPGFRWSNRLRLQLLRKLPHKPSSTQQPTLRHLGLREKHKCRALRSKLLRVKGSCWVKSGVL